MTGIAFRREGYREETQLFLVRDLPERKGFSFPESRVVLVKAGQQGAA